MQNVVFTSLLMQAVTAVAALLLIWVLFRVLDKGTGMPFSKAIETIYQSPNAVALYYGLRFLGACVLIGQLLS